MSRGWSFVAAAVGIGALLMVLWRSGPAAPAIAPPLMTGPGAFGGLDTARGIEQFETRIREDPRDFISLTILGQLYARKAREVGDLALLRTAERAYRRALELRPDHTPATAALAAAYASQHKFAEALELARSLYEQSPSSVDALATMADAYLETGRYQEGEEAVRTLARRVGNVPAVLARRALVAELGGRTAEAIALLTRAVERLREHAEPPREIAWFEARLGDIYFHAGCLARSEEHFTRSLQLDDRYPFGLAGLGDVRTAQGRLQEAADLYARGVAIAPEPSSLFDLAAVYERMGRAAEAQQLYARAQEAATRPDIHQPAYYRELAMAYADLIPKPEAALAFAEKDLEVRKDVGAYDTLAWALFRNGRLREAASAIGEALKLGTREPGFHHHAGMIHEALGERDRAREYLEQSLQMSPYMLPDSARETLTRLGGSTEVQRACNPQS